MKSTVEEIRRRFDLDVDRFSNLETGQSATIDAPLAMELVASAAAAATPNARHILDVGCGAGNYTLKVLQLLPEMDVTLIDLSQPMLEDFSTFYRILRPGGSIWIFDLIESSIPSVQPIFWKKYGDYLTQLKNEIYRDHVFDYIAKEDTPKPLMYQLDLLRNVGFSQVEILHKNLCFAAFGAMKS